ncbi:Tetratricopeptide TPR_1 repeat-containing protein [Isosphaera pallida ATCC 43644]|uniref:Tetratricopeptide TPR_1 repeat-containing protein n=1 Tax=Isosphaera pallida (strain ATCC 43644 / DSM 9630 / IS1B) TaxID=575540 RepID=E8R0E9_ISOPI|nr:tetratricopeptide repeat protein [Isosphaera pallida]ADV63281.1 Tetratricopeptide TPR_1 repeat-containing protein [Isosphaera pallida ATCC 43644]
MNDPVVLVVGGTALLPLLAFLILAFRARQGRASTTPDLTHRPHLAALETEKVGEHPPTPAPPFESRTAIRAAQILGVLVAAVILGILLAAPMLGWGFGEPQTRFSASEKPSPLDQSSPPLFQALPPHAPPVDPLVEQSARQILESLEASSSPSPSQTLGPTDPSDTAIVTQAVIAHPSETSNGQADPFSIAKPTTDSPNEPTSKVSSAVSNTPPHDPNDPLERYQRDRDAKAANAAGAKAYSEGRFEEAIEHFTQAIRRQPLGFKGYYNRGQAFYRLGRVDKALEDLDEAVRLQPDDPYPRQARGTVNSLLKRHDQAIEDFSAAIRANPTNPALYRQRGLAYRAKGDEEAAQRDFATARKLGGD